MRAIPMHPVRTPPVIRLLALFLANAVALVLLTFPVYGFIAFFDWYGLRKYFGVSAGLLLVTLLGVWPRLVGRRGKRSFIVGLLIAYLIPVIAFGVSMHKLTLHESSLKGLVFGARLTFLIGGAFTAGYWIPVSVLNYFVLRRELEKPRELPDPWKTGEG